MLDLDPSSGRQRRERASSGMPPPQRKATWVQPRLANLRVFRKAVGGQRRLNLVYPPSSDSSRLMAGNQIRPQLSQRGLRSKNMVEDGIAYSRPPLKNDWDQRLLNTDCCAFRIASNNSLPETWRVKFSCRFLPAENFIRLETPGSTQS